MAELKEINVTFWENKQHLHLSESYQTIGMQYAFLSSESDGSRQCHPWVKCRDFLNDALRGYLTGKEEHIYGFSYSLKDNPPIDLEEMRMLVKYKPTKNVKKGHKALEDILNCSLSILRGIEEHCGISSLSELRCTQDREIYLFEGSADWMGSTFMISMYTFLIRLGGRNIVFESKEGFDSELEKLSKKTKGMGDNDIYYLQDVKEYIFKIIENRENLKYIKEKGKHSFGNVRIGTFHNYSGIVSLCKEAKGRISGVEEIARLSKYIKDEESEPKHLKMMEKGS